MRRLLPSVLGAALLAVASLLLAPPASATRAPATIPLPVDFQPEGIAVGRGDTFYVGSLRSGDIYRGHLRTGRGSLFVDTAGRQAVGMRVDEARKLLFVAGGIGGHVYVYSTRDGSQVADIAVAGPSTFTNDVALTRHAAYFTDTFAPRIYKLPYGRRGFGTPQAITVTGPAGVSDPGTFGLNGIDATADGSTLVVDHTNEGIVALVDPDTGVSREITLTGGSLVPATPDGLQLEGHWLYVVENFANMIAKIKLSGNLTAGRIVRTITSGNFEVPSTAAVKGNLLAVVNAKFDLGLPPPFSPGAPPGTPFEVVTVRK
jgi:hypothetical protein